MWIRKEESVDQVSLERIDITDRYYSITPCPFNEERLISSIRSIGVSVPVILEPCEGETLKIVSGFRRIDALLKLGSHEVPAVIEKRKDPRRTFWRVVLENMGHRNLHEIEKAEVVFKMRTLHEVGENEILADCLPGIGLKGTRYELQRMMSLAEMKPTLKKACLEGSLMASTALEMKNWPEAEAEFIVQLINHLRLGTNKQRELVRLAGDLKRIRNTDLDRVWRDSGLAGSPPGELTFDLVKASLSRARFPELAKQIDRWNELRDDLALSPRLQLQVPRYFDGDSVTVSFKASSPDEFRDLADEVQKISRVKALEKIFALL